jgi:hypothetical protein
MTQVVNVRVKYIRPTYENLKEWIDDENNEYIGRGGIVFIDGVRFPENPSIWANPFKSEISREESLRKFKEYIIKKIEKENLYKDLLELDGKKLGCWCKPESCHGDVLVELINEYKKNKKI